MKYLHTSMAAILGLAGCGVLPPTPRVQAPAPAAPAGGVLAVRVVGPLSLLPLGFQLPLNARRLDLPNGFFDRNPAIDVPLPPGRCHH